MNLVVLTVLMVGSPRSVEMRFSETAPVIDGFIEQTWQAADSAYDFVQHQPYEKTPPSEPTVVYLLQDKNNLYAAFRCWARNVKPVVSLSAYEDRVVLFLDPFGSKTTAYYFRLTPTGCPQDGWILDDGRTSDDSWDGVWFYAVRVYPDRYEVEFKIPFTSIRYKKGLSEWGINFRRYLAKIQENTFWTEYSQKEGFQVSKFGVATGIQPRSTGYSFELYPEGFVRADRIEQEQASVKPSASVNVKWDITPQVTVNGTLLPDFAQIESDPYTINLSRYKTYLSERRPFFLEGKDIFRMASFGDESDFHSPLSIFYSRRIGKSVGNTFVPIIGGIKLTAKSETWDLGGFGAYTDGVYESHGDSMVTVEPERTFAVVRARHRLLPTFDLGLLLSASAADRNNYNYALGMDGVCRSGPNQLIVQGAVSDKNKKTGWALSSGFSGHLKNLMVLASAEVVDDSFDVGDIGYVPWAGRKTFAFIPGPMVIFPTGPVRSLWVAPGAGIVQEPGSTDWSKVISGMVNAHFRSNWGFFVDAGAGDYYEAGFHYQNRRANISFWANSSGCNVETGATWWYGYNWLRGFLAHQLSQWFSINRTIALFNFSLSSNLWVEGDTVGSVRALTPTATPRVSVIITNRMSLSIFNQLVFSIPGTDFSRAEFTANRFGLLFSWNFRPKSWFYVAFNDYQEQAPDGRLALKNQVGAVKIKYLVYF